MGKLKKYIYDESNGLYYTLVGNYHIPDLKLPEERLDFIIEQMKTTEEVINSKLIYI